MRVRIKFDADLVIEGKDMKEVCHNWESLPLFTKDAMKCGVEFGEIILIEDAETYDDLSDEYNNVSKHEVL